MLSLIPEKWLKHRRKNRSSPGFTFFWCLCPLAQPLSHRSVSHLAICEMNEARTVFPLKRNSFHKVTPIFFFPRKRVLVWFVPLQALQQHHRPWFHVPGSQNNYLHSCTPASLSQASLYSYLYKRRFCFYAESFLYMYFLCTKAKQWS